MIVYLHVLIKVILIETFNFIDQSNKIISNIYIYFIRGFKPHWNNYFSHYISNTIFEYKYLFSRICYYFSFTGLVSIRFLLIHIIFFLKMHIFFVVFLIIFLLYLFWNNTKNNIWSGQCAKKKILEILFKIQILFEINIYNKILPQLLFQLITLIITDEIKIFPLYIYSYKKNKFLNNIFLNEII